MIDLADVYTRLMAGEVYGHGHHWRPVWARVAARLALQPKRTLLDVGCGRGGMVTYARSQGIEAEGCDLAPCEPWITRAALPYLPYADGQFAVTGCFDVLEHLPEADVPAAIAELRRVASGGLYVSVAWCSDHRDVPGIGPVELHLTQRPLAWWLQQLGPGAVPIPAPGQPAWRAYVAVPPHQPRS